MMSVSSEHISEKAADVILIYPRTGLDLGPTVMSPHSLLTIAAPLVKEGYKVKIIDQRVDPDWAKKLTSLLQSKPICVGISSMVGTQIYFALSAADIVRKHTDRKVPIVWGGPHPSILPEQTLESEMADIVCVGEGDITFLELVRALEKKGSLSEIKGIAYKDGGQIIRTEERPLLDVETLLPVPWELIDVEKYIHRDFYLKNSFRTLDIGQTSRGCPFQCGFCCSAVLRKRKWRAISAELSLERIVDSVKRFKLDGIWIRDDEFYIDKDRASEICRGMIDAKLNVNFYTSGTRVDVFNNSTDEQIALLKRAGAHVLKFGAESGSNRILKLMNKGICVEDTIKANVRAKKHGIIPAFALMAGFPTETMEEINQTIDLHFWLKEDNPNAQFESIAPFTPLPGTPLFDYAVKFGLKAPQSLEEWTKWDFEVYDATGSKNPWLSSLDRKRVANISTMYMLANAVKNVVSVIENKPLRYFSQSIFAFVAPYFSWRLKRKSYTFVPELKIPDFIKRNFFSKSRFVVR